MSPDAEATFHRASCTLGNQVVVASDGTPFLQERRPTCVCRTPGADSGLLTEASGCHAGEAWPQNHSPFSAAQADPVSS
jgi:hypothetical protein